MIVVVDTNVLVAGLLTPFGPSARIVDLLLGGHITLAVDDRILAEYREVLRRPKFAFKPGDVGRLMDFVGSESMAVSATPLGTALPDPSDAPFLEAALAAKVDALTTWNLRHFPVRSRTGMKVVSPPEFLGMWKDRA